LGERGAWRTAPIRNGVDFELPDPPDALPEPPLLPHALRTTATATAPTRTPDRANLFDLQCMVALTDLS